MQFKYTTKNVYSATPIIDLQVENYFGKSLPVKGKLDTGADMTMIPEYLTSELNLEKLNTTTMLGLADGTKIQVNKYSVHIKIGETKFGLMTVITSKNDYVLVGRDLINLWTLTLDGKNKVGNIDIWSTQPKDAWI